MWSKGLITLNKFYIFLIRVVLSAAFAVILGRVFFPDSNPVGVAALGIFMLGAAYLAEFLRNRKSQ